MADDTTRTATDLYAVAWNHGTPSRRSAPEAPIQVHRHDQRTWILRQSKTLNYEAPFLFLLLGTERALLLDTGAVGDPEAFPSGPRSTRSWRSTWPRIRARTTDSWSPTPIRTATTSPPTASSRTGRQRWSSATESRRFGSSSASRTTPGPPAPSSSTSAAVRWSCSLPGHHEASVTVHDPATGWLLTGDTVLPGRLYISDAAAYLATLDRLVDFAKTHEVSHVLGCHVEMTDRPRRDYPWELSSSPGSGPSR
ncbi:MBL fold metallo-hydrolase [Streptacidiphilus monticola]